ncbi:hypothetical protein FHQ18_07160 [Deferribacter autotrophicus]|uniref:Uncharacterized protein n=1 Tax=Deferribacter autotrophicus TaxID=500465 RepID=A0A5A8F537_9BACT|nr:hypothetical protein [Deferribacter autotrophicus]KAA0258165.1 hypothetical protein FHQ18_07160 [Deferribacter autotrophicus]
MRIIICIKIILIILLIPLLGLSENENFEFPQEIHELENVIIVVHKKTDFKISISNKCLQVFQMNGITVNKGIYSASGNNSYLELENKCFEGDDVIIKIDIGDKYIEKKYKILPQIKEEREWGC